MTREHILASPRHQNHNAPVLANGDTPAGQSDELLPEPWQLVRAARGFSALFWGLPISTMLYFNAVEIRAISQLSFPAYVVGMGVVVMGLLHLHRARFESSTWSRYSRRSLFAGFLILYMAPVVFWYRVLPPLGTYYAVNIACLTASVVWLLLGINRLVEGLGVVTANPDLSIEARLCGWSVVVLMVIPVTGLLAISVFLSVKYQSTILSEIRTLQETLPSWIHIFLLVPLSLTMIVTWKAKEQCLDALKGRNSPAIRT